MAIEDRFLEIRAFCEANADSARAAKYGRYFTEGYDAYGLEQAPMEAQRDAWLAAWRDELGLEGFLVLGDRLVCTGKYEEASFAILFAAALADEFTAATLDRFGWWLDHGFRNWAHTDYVATEVLAGFVTRGIVPFEAFRPWRKAASRWKRRAVPVLLIKVLRAGAPVPRLLKFLPPMMADGEKVVQQGIGWFLREAWKRAPEQVEAFLLDWKETCGRVIVQYATEKMTPEQKLRFRRTKVADAEPRPSSRSW